MSSLSLNSTCLSATPTTTTDTSIRRSSSRPIKRKKFDDELVESSLKFDRPRVKADQKHSCNIPSQMSSVSLARSSLSLNFSTPKIETSAFSSESFQSSSSVLSPGSDVVSMDSPTEIDLPISSRSEIMPEIFSKGKYNPSRNKKTRTGKIHFSRSKTSSWTPQDDLMLITAVEQTCDISAVHLSVKFSRPYSLTDIKERWYNLLYNQTISRTAMSAIKMLPMETVDSLLRKTPYSLVEEQLLKEIPATPKPDLLTFEKLLEDNSDSFHPARTATCLFHHWSIMKDYDLLPPTGCKTTKIPKFMETLNKMNDSDSLENTEIELERELQIEAMRTDREITDLEAEVKRLRKVIVKNVVGITGIDFDNETYAILKGRFVQYFMKAKHMTLGRSTDDNVVDADLSREGPAHKISRQHFTIRLLEASRAQDCSQSEGDQSSFILHNQSTRVVFVDGAPVQKGGKIQLKDNSMIEVSCLRFTFHINDDLVKSINHDVQPRVDSIETAHTN